MHGSHSEHERASNDTEKSPTEQRSTRFPGGAARAGQVKIQGIWAERNLRTCSPWISSTQG